MISRFSLALVLGMGIGTAVLGSPAHSFAQEAEEADSEKVQQQARQAAKEGLTAYQAGDYAKALESFERARGLYPSAQIVRMTGYSLIGLSRWVKAADLLEAALASQVVPLDPADRKDVEDQLAKAMQHLGMVQVTSKIAGAQVVVDGGEPRALPLDKPLRLLEGTHQITVGAPDHEDATNRVTVEPGKTIDVALDPKAIEIETAPPPPALPKKTVAPPPPPPRQSWFPHQRAVGFVAAGAGLALGGAALATGLAGARIRSNVEGDVAIHFKTYGQECDKGDYRSCVFDRAIINQDADRADLLRNVSIGLAAGAGVLVVGGTVLILAAGAEGPAKPEHKASASRAIKQIACGPTAAPGFSCVGSF